MKAILKEVLFSFNLGFMDFRNRGLSLYKNLRRLQNSEFWSYDTKVVPGECTIGRHGDSFGHFNELPKGFTREQLVSPTLPDREALEKPTARRVQRL